jgi:hypothetical protein
MEHHLRAAALLKKMVGEGSLVVCRDDGDRIFYRGSGRNYNREDNKVFVKGREVRPLADTYNPHFNPPVKHRTHRKGNSTGGNKYTPVFWDDEKLKEALIADKITYTRALEIKNLLDKGEQLVWNLG